MAVLRVARSTPGTRDHEPTHPPRLDVLGKQVALVGYDEEAIVKKSLVMMVCLLAACSEVGREPAVDPGASAATGKNDGNDGGQAMMVAPLLTDEEVQGVVDALDSICPDTFCAGD